MSARNKPLGMIASVENDSDRISGGDSVITEQI